MPHTAGKMTILDKLELGEPVKTIPTSGLVNVEALEYNSFNLNIWDIGGQDNQIRALWREYYHNTHGLIFVVDSNDVGRIDEARNELHKLLEEDELKDAIIVIYANKQDLPNVVNPQEMASLLRLNTVTNRPWQIYVLIPAADSDGICVRKGFITNNSFKCEAFRVING